VRREAFCWLPLAYCLKGKVLVLHGGLFESDDVTLADIRNVDRYCEPPDKGIMCECLWSDPQPEPGRAPSKRGCGIQFGAAQRPMRVNGVIAVLPSGALSLQAARLHCAVGIRLPVYTLLTVLLTYCWQFAQAQHHICVST
jgi:diadenosine tetraphosphatase ApaH/serine/threonine PP2A family protein phosphatase